MLFFGAKIYFYLRQSAPFYSFSVSVFRKLEHLLVFDANIWFVFLVLPPKLQPSRNPCIRWAGNIFAIRCYCVLAVNADCYSKLFCSVTLLWSLMLVCWLVGRLVSGLVGRSVCPNILKGREVTHPCSEHLCNKRIALWWELFFSINIIICFYYWKKPIF